MKVDWKAYAAGVEKDLDQLRNDLAPLEAGELRIGERPAGESWRDVTAETIERHKRTIKTYEAILQDVRANRIGEQQ